MKVVNLVPLWSGELGALLDRGIAYVPVDPDDATRRDSELADADVVISRAFDETLSRAAVRMRLLVSPNAGTERIRRDLLPAGARVVNGAGHEIPIAEYAIAGIVAMRQRFLQADRGLREGRWLYSNHRPESWVEEVYGSTLGLVGYGRIGHEIAVRARAFGMACRAVTLHPGKTTARAEGLTRLDGLRDARAVDELFVASDAVVLCCELSALTAGLVDARRLALMKPGAVLVNVARGEICVEQDLYEALRDRRIAGAVIDVWYRYPRDLADEPTLPSRFPFHDLDDVIMTPHSSDWTLGQKRRKLSHLANAINAFARERG
ncbi:MAG TPA: 2-hydroxyacid dehydrogenase [Candidatus Dormibacteraeota bacterium]|nr:2-hydroxyacid dehydrogenase [Candidatus Dormibacteraeota bacterium]